jgi:hypothetical protein
MVAATKRQLLQVVDALSSAGGLACRLHSWQQQRHQDADNGDHDQQFDERKSSRERARIKYRNTRPHD